MAATLLHDANRAAATWIESVGPRKLRAAIALGLLAAAIKGSIVLAVAPVLLLMVIHFVRFQPLDRLMIVVIAATLGLDHPSEQPFAGLWHSPIQIFGNLWFHAVRRTVSIVPIPLSPAVLVAFWLLFRACTELVRRPDKGTRLYLRACAVAVTAIGAAAIYGIARGGDSQQMLYQVTVPLVTVALGAVACLLATPALLRQLERILLLIAGVRALVCIYVYATVFRRIGGDYLYVSTHSDSVLWVVALALVLGRLITTFRLENQRGRVGLSVILLVAIIVNNRRLAWVELAVIVVYTFWAVPPRLQALRGRVALVAIPLVGFYAAIGMSAPPSPIFAPVQALTSVNSSEDSSTLSREIENSNLMVTIREGGPLGIGFGHEYTETIVGPDISKAFPQYRYLPHNSLLGLIAFAGPLGFVAFWLPLLLGMAAAARLRRHPSPHLRAASVWLAASIVCFALMAWGDIGLQTNANGIFGSLGAGLAAGLARQRIRSEPSPHKDLVQHG